jgi:gliding motility-associated-like protein
MESTLVATKGGVYSVLAEDRTTGCSVTKSTTVTVSSPPFNTRAEVTSDAFASTHTIEVFAEGFGNYQYKLDNGVFQEDPIFRNVLPGTHTVVVTDTNGCGTVRLADIVVIDYPRFVTPNGDGFNDTWNIKEISIISPDAKVYIFDRFGKLLRELDPNGPGWDGTYNGNPLPSSDYWFRIDYTEDNISKEFKGHFTLKR